MIKNKTTSSEKFNKDYTEAVKILPANFNDMTKGQKMLISSPGSIAGYIHSIKVGDQRAVKQMRLGLAKKSNADNACPLTTGIFLRIAIEVSLEEQGRDKGNIPNLPFWRLLIDDKSALLKKLPHLKDLINDLRESERV